ncbi:MAG: DEAD/DEAH box helicase [Abditibacteriota bacterium]|nr:DEAD/DEAH box helicase [Abditibacteriota bacterium]
MSFDTKDAAALYREARSLSERLGQVRQEEAKARQAIVSAAEKAIKPEIEQGLRDTPVTALQDEVVGWKPELLPDRYTNYQELKRDMAGSLKMYLKPEPLAAVKKAVEDKERELRGRAVPRIDAEKKDPMSALLMMAAVNYYNDRALFDSIRDFDARHPDLDRLTEELKPLAGFFGRLFASGDKKKKALAAGEALSGMVQEWKEPRSSKNVLSAQKAWEIYEKNSIAIFGMLERLLPDLFTVSEEAGEVYGLPEELAEAIACEDLSLEGLECTLRTYQEWGVRYILRQKRTLLGDEMGLGKTVQAIAAMVSVRNSGGCHFLVICPAAVIANWTREIEKFSDITAYRIHGAGKEETIKKWRSDGGCAVMSYEGTEIFTDGDRTQIDLLVADEAHYIKNPEAQRTQRAAKLARRAGRVLFMTGTPLENKREEMVSIIDMLQPEVSRSLRRPMSPREFREAVIPVYYRRKREQVLGELPELTDAKSWDDMNPEDTEAYKRALAGGNFHDVRRVSWITEDMTRSSKAQRLQEIIENARAQQRKLIVFSCYLKTLERVTALPGVDFMPAITGSLPPQKRQAIIDDFEKAPAGTVLPAQIQAGGTGLNIQAASVVVLCEPQLKPSIENQAISRAYRMGQTRNVLVYRLLCEDTIDEQILDLLKEKQNIFDQVADVSEAAGKDPQMVSLLKAEQERYA